MFPPTDDLDGLSSHQNTNDADDMPENADLATAPHHLWGGRAREHAAVAWSLVLLVAVP